MLPETKLCLAHTQVCHTVAGSAKRLTQIRAPIRGAGSTAPPGPSGAVVRTGSTDPVASEDEEAQLRALATSARASSAAGSATTLALAHPVSDLMSSR